MRETKYILILWYYISVLINYLFLCQIVRQCPVNSLAMFRFKFLDRISCNWGALSSLYRCATYSNLFLHSVCVTRKVTKLCIPFLFLFYLEHMWLRMPALLNWWSNYYHFNLLDTCLSKWGVSKFINGLNAIFNSFCNSNRKPYFLQKRGKTKLQP